MRKSIIEKVMKQTDEQNLQMAESYIRIAEHNANRAIECNNDIKFLLWKIDLEKRKIEEYKKVSDQFSGMANDCYEAMKLKKEMDNE